MKDRLGGVVYVGKARDLRRRVSQYFHPSRRHGWDPKLNALVDAIHDFDWHVVRNEPEALLLEGRLIKDFRPRFNIDFRDDKRFLLLKVNLLDPIPRFTLTRLRKDDGARYFGPFAHSGSLRRTLTLARRRFRLRGCRALTPGEEDFKHCLFANLKHCTAPCVGHVSLDAYRDQIRAACEFLDGQAGALEAELEIEMRNAASLLDFERAAALRDALNDLRVTTQRTEKFERIPYKLPVAINPEADVRELERALGLPRPPSRIEGFDISNISGTFIVASLVSFWHGRPDRANYRRFRIRTVSGQNDFGAIAEAVRRRYSRQLREGRQPTDIPAASDAARLDPLGPAPETFRREEGLPDLVVIDGGRGQLNAARGELEKLGLGGLAVIGLAKEFEEIYRPDTQEPLRLPMSNGALKLLQRVRDESHRFANTYNAELRLKRISESLLDEFPGLGEVRKQALLRHFGSLAPIRAANAEELAKAPGIGPKIAERLRAFLDARQSRTPAAV